MRENMTFEGFRKAVLATRTLLESHVGHAIPAMRVTDKPWVSEHLSWMLAEAIRFYEQGKPQKANRWLGFVQGVMASKGYSLEELKRANMPEGEQFDAEKL
jgi:hypothetical protein